MKIRIVSLIIASLSIAACAEAPAPVSAEQQFVDDVAAAMGGAVAIEAATSLAMDGEEVDAKSILGI